VRVFGGPSFFRLKADMVQDIEFDQAASIFSRANFVSITGYDQIEVEGSGIGFHAGADMSVFFARVVGLGAFARCSRGTVSVDPEPTRGRTGAARPSPGRMAAHFKLRRTRTSSVSRRVYS
jgi:hypothetical protein